MMKRTSIPSSAPKVALFAVCSLALIALLGTLVGNLAFVPRNTFHALFTDATGVFPGDRVRLSGVEVGRVESLDMVARGDRRLARVTFSVDEGVPIYRSAELELRYENIVGQRYLAVVEDAADGAEMAPGATFPLRQTRPALSLTQLFNGFQPLFDALDPAQVNRFTFELVRAFQGESAAIGRLVASTAKLANSLADKDEVIGRLVRNMGVVLDGIAEQNDELGELIETFTALMVGLSQDRDEISTALLSLNTLLGDTASLVGDVREPLTDNVDALSGVVDQLNRDREVLDESLDRVPRTLRTMIRTASYGSWFTFYICGLDVHIRLLGGVVDLGGVGIEANEKDTVCGKDPSR